MTLKQYKAFIYSVDCGSLSLGAKRLGATQSGLTHLIINMEEELGFTLMVRNKSGVKLTADGKRIYPIIKEIVELDGKAHALASKMRGEKSSVITVATFSSVAVNWLPVIINEYQKLHPEVKINTIDGHYGEIRSALESGVADLGFIGLPIGLNAQTVPLVKDEMVAVLPPNFPAFEGGFDIKRFESEPVISLLESTDDDSRLVFEKHGVTPNVKYRTGDDYAMISMVENNLGICMQPEMILSNRVANVKISKLNPPEFRTIGLCIPYENLKHENVVEFYEYILLWIKKNCKNNLL